MSVKYTVKLDLTDNGAFDTGWRIKQGDFSDSLIIVKVVNNGETYYDSSDIPHIVFHRPDGKSVIGTMSAGNNNSYQYSMIGNELQVAGLVVMDVKFGGDDSSRTSTASCTFTCVEDTIKDNATPADIYTGITLEQVDSEATIIATSVASAVTSSEMGTITSEITSLSASTSAIASSLSEFSASTTSEIATINSNVSSLSASVSSATSEILTHTSEIASLSTATSELASEVTYIGSEVAVNTSDIADLKNKPSSALVLTSSSPLTTSSASNILGIECEGKSEQEGTPTPTNPIPIVDASGVVVAHTINLTDKQTTGSNLALPKPLPIGTYTISFETDMASNSFRLSNSTDTSKDSISSGSRVSLGNNRYAITLTTTFESNYYSTNANGGTYVKNIMIEQGTSASDYVPYQSNSINIDGNLIDFNKVVQGSLYSADGSEASATNRLRTDYISVANGKTYTISCVGCEVRTVYEYNASKGFVKYILASGSTYSYTSTSNSYIRILFRYTDDSTIMPNKDMHLRCIDGSAIILRSIGTVADTLVVKQDGSGVLTKRVGTVDLGTLTYEYKNSRFQTVLSDIAQITTARTQKVASDIYSCISDGSSASGIDNVVYTVSGGVVCIQDSRTTAPNTFKTNVSGHTLYYPLATPTTTTLTSTQVASILALRTYNGTTIVDSEIVNTVTYSADVKTYVDDRCNYVSSTEMVVGEFDGKPLYRKVVEFESSYSAGLAVIITDEAITIKRIDGCVKYKNRIYPIGCKSNKFDVYIDNNALNFDCDYMDEGYGTITAIVEYTKDDVNTLSEVSE